MTFTSIKRRKIHEDVASQIEEAIIKGTLIEGENLPSERDLMQTFGVGRPAVREALLLLEKSGFLQLSVGGRARISHPTVSVMIDQLSGSAKHLLASNEGQQSFQDARRVFEAAIARNAAEIATPQDISRLRSALDENRASLNDMSAFEKTDVAFHLTLAEIGNNPVFFALHSAIFGWLSMQRHVTLRVKNAAKNALQSHEEIFQAVHDHQPDQAWYAMDSHLRQVMQQYNQSQGNAL